MSCSKIQDLGSIYSGDTYEITVTLTDENGAAIDITNDTVELNVKASKSDVAALINKSNGVGEHTTPISGITDFSLSPAETDTLTEGTSYYVGITWLRASPAGEFTALDGRLTILQSVRG